MLYRVLIKRTPQKLIYRGYFTFLKLVLPVYKTKYEHNI